MRRRFLLSCSGFLLFLGAAATKVAPVMANIGNFVLDRFCRLNLEKFLCGSLFVYERRGAKGSESSNSNDAWGTDVEDGVNYYVLVALDEKAVSNYFHVLKRNNS